jgi:hypothetical protein
MDYAFTYLKTHSIELEKDYRYTAEDGTCKYTAAKGVVKTTGYVDVKANSPSDL